MRFLIGVVCVIALFEAVIAQGRCELCKVAANSLGTLDGEITERRCEHTVSRQARDMCSDFADAKELFSNALQTSKKICEALGFCMPPPIPISIQRLDLEKVVDGAVEVVADTAPIVAGGFAVAFLAWMYASLPAMAPALLFGRRKRDLASTERNTAGIYGEEEDNPFEYMDPTLNPSSNLPEETDAYMKQAASTLKCELCKLGISIDSSNATLLRTGQDGAPMRKLLCRSLPGKGDQRKCMTVLRQASEILLQIVGSIFDSLETCEGLKSCQVG